jgi:hypothetical protein
MVSYGTPFEFCGFHTVGFRLAYERLLICIECINIWRVLISVQTKTISSFHTKRFVFAGDRARMPSETSFIPSKL